MNMLQVIGLSTKAALKTEQLCSWLKETNADQVEYEQWPQMSQSHILLIHLPESDP